MFYKFVSKITKELVKQSLRVTVGTPILPRTSSLLIHWYTLFYTTAANKERLKRDKRGGYVFCNSSVREKNRVVVIQVRVDISSHE